MQILHLNTKIIYGENGVKNLINELNGSNIKKLFINFSGGGLLKTKLYQEIQDAMEDAGIQFKIFSDIQPNPQTKDIDNALEIMFKFNPEMILSVGGGSTHDASKVIATCYANDWKKCTEYIYGKVTPKNTALPLATVVTAVGTSSENNIVSVITDSETHFKATLVDPTVLPKFCISDPSLTFTVSPWQTACGGFDAFCHLLEDFYSRKTFDFTRNIIIALMKTVIKATRETLKNPNDFEARGNMMMASSYALNFISKFNNVEGGWNMHWLGHAISGKYDATHGASLALVMPVYLDWCHENVNGYKERTKELGQEIFGVNSAQETVKSIRDLIKEFGLPQKFTDLREVDSISEKDIDWLVDHFVSDKGELSGSWEKVIPKNAKEIFNLIKR